MAKAKRRKPPQNGRKKTATKRHPSAVKGKPTPDCLPIAVRSNSDNIDATLARGEDYLVKGHEDRIAETIGGLESLTPLPDRRQRGRLQRLLAVRFAHENRLVEAEEAIEQGLKEYPKSPDFYYTLCHVKILLSEFDKALAAGNMYLSLLADGTQDQLDLNPCYAGTPHRACLLNRVGMAYRQLERAAEAVRCFERSIADDPHYNLPYLNLAELHLKAGRREEAAALIERGLEKCEQVHELRMLQSRCRSGESVSACMIVKNEEELLGGCLESIRDWVDDIVIVDTGSTDRTVEIAQSYGARVFYQEWEGDFSKHRNYSIDQAKSDWVFIIDADEQMYSEDIPQLKTLLNDERVKVVSLNVINVYGKHEDRTVFLPSPRFFRRELDLRYKGIVHNQLDIPEDLPVVRTAVNLKHFGYDLPPEKMQAKIARSRALLEKQLEADPDNPFALFNLAQLHRVGLEDDPKGRAPIILDSARRAMELTSHEDPAQRHIHLMALDQLAWTHFYLQDYDEALEYCRRALEYKENYLDPMLLLAHISLRRNRYDEAVEQYTTYLEAQQRYNPALEMDNLILLQVDSRVIVYYNLGLIMRLKGDLPEARQWFLKALQLNPEYLDANYFVGEIYEKDHDLALAEDYLLRQLELDRPGHEAALHLADLYAGQNLFEKAEVFYEKARQISPDDVTVLGRLAQCYLDSNREENVSELLRRARSRARHDPEMKRSLAALHLQFGRFTEAADMYRELINAGQTDAELYNDLANCCYRQGDFEQAESCYRKALESGEVPAVVYRNIGLALGQLQRSEEAATFLEQYLELDPEAHEILHIIGDLYAKAGQHASALKYYERFLGKFPTDVLALFNLSECYLNMGHTDSAIMGYRRALELNPSYAPARQRLGQLVTVVEKT